MRHHDPLVAKPLQQRVLWKREVVLKIVVDLFVLSVQNRACMQLRAHAHARALVSVQKKSEPRNYAPFAPKCSNACASMCVRCCYILCGDLVMLARNELEVVSVLVLLIVLQALLSPRAPALAVFPVRFGHPLYFPIHEKLKGTEEQNPGVLASEAVCVDKWS